MFRITIAALVLLLATTCMGLKPGSAQEDVWAPPEPSAKEKDWVRVSSGEWLKGTIDLMRDEVLYFDSKEFDDLTIDWVDVAEIRSPGTMTYVLLDGTLMIGTSAMKGNLVKIDTAQGVQEIPRARILSILEGKPSELNFWSAKIGASLKILTGNTTQDDFNTQFFIKREAARTRLDLKWQSNFSKTNEVETVNNNRAIVDLQWFLSRKFFLSPFKGEYYYDKFQNIDMRITLGVGLGYYLTRSKKTDLFVELGLSYQETKFSSVQEGEDPRQENGSIPFKTTLETDITKRVDLTAEYGVQIATNKGGNTSHHTYILLEFEFFKDFDFDASLTWDHNTNPTTNADGDTPLKDDVTMYYGLSLNF